MQQHLSELRDDKLLELIQGKGDDPDLASEAWKELYSRHAEFVYNCVKKAGDMVGRGFDAEDIVVDTFEHVYSRAAVSFKSGEYDDDEKVQSHVRVWLCGIARYRFLNTIEKRGRESLADREPAFWATVKTGNESDGVGQKSRISVKSVVQRVLSKEDQEIVWAKIQHYDTMSGESRFPSEELSALCERLGITKPTLRKRYERALRKIQIELAAAGIALSGQSQEGVKS